MGGKSWPDEFEAIVIGHLPAPPPDASLAADAPLESFGLDSLGMVNLLLDLEDTFAVVFPDELMVKETFSSAGRLWAAIDGLRDGTATTATTALGANS